MNYLFLLTLFTLSLTSQIIPIQPQTQVSQIFIRIRQHKQITSPPHFPFSSIYSKSVYSLDQQNNQQDFSSTCQQQPATIQFTSTFQSRLNIYETSVQKDIITTFEQIKADRKILDTILFKDRAYLLLRDNNLVAFDTKSHKQAARFSVPSLAEKQSIESGFFVETDQKLFLVTRYEAFIIFGDTIEKLEGYQNFTDFESARSLFGTFFAVCGINSGVVIFSYQNNKLVTKLTLDSSFFNRGALFISDLAYNSDKKEIFISDLKFGINIVKLESQGTNISATLESKGYRKTGCNVIVYVDGNLYASCDDLFKVRYASDEAIINMPNPMFRVKELLIHKGLIVAVGEDLITKYYNDKLTEETPEFDITERLIFYSDNRYLMANYFGIQAGTFNIKYPSLLCSTYNESMQEVVSAVIKTQAECSPQYFSQHRITPPQTPTPTDTCLYTHPVQFIFWQSQQFDMDVIFIIMGVLFVVAAIIVTWAIFIYSKEAYLKRTLEMYTNPNSVQMTSGTQIQGYNVMVEENKESENDIGETGKQLQIGNRPTHSID